MSGWVDFGCERSPLAARPLCTAGRAATASRQRLTSLKASARGHRKQLAVLFGQILQDPPPSAGRLSTRAGMRLLGEIRIMKPFGVGQK